MENRKHFRFYFACRDTSECLYDGYFDTEEKMATFAQGLCVGIRHFRDRAEIIVYLVKEDGTRETARIQR